jgi:hypothetical protein
VRSASSRGGAFPVMSDPLLHWHLYVGNRGRWGWVSGKSWALDQLGDNKGQEKKSKL